MKQTSYYRVAFFLLALLSLMFLIGVSCSSAPKKVELTDETVDHWNATVEKVIAEPERAAKLKNLGQQLFNVSESIQQDIEVLNQKAMALNENYDASKEEFQQLVNDFAEKRDPKFDNYRDIIFAMRSEVSAEEWKHLMK